MKTLGHRATLTKLRDAHYVAVRLWAVISPHHSQCYFMLVYESFDCIAHLGVC